MPLAGERVKASDLDFPITQARGTTITSLANNAQTSVGLQTEDFDDSGMHDNVTNNPRFTVPAGRAGRYLASGGVGFAGNATGRRGARLALNGISVAGSAQLLPAGSASTLAVATRAVMIGMAVGDYLEVQGFQDSGGALNTSITSEVQSHLTVEYRGEG